MTFSRSYCEFCGQCRKNIDLKTIFIPVPPFSATSYGDDESNKGEQRTICAGEQRTICSDCAQKILDYTKAMIALLKTKESSVPCFDKLKEETHSKELTCGPTAC